MSQDRATIVRSKDAKNDTEVFEWGSLSWIANERSTGLAEMSAAKVVIRSGMANPLHVHDDSAEMLHLLRGRLTHSIAEVTVELQAGDTLVVPAGSPHNALSTGSEDAEMIVVYATGTRSYREVSVPGDGSKGDGRK